MKAYSLLFIFYFTDQAERSLEDLKKTIFSKKLLEIHNTHFPIYVSCLLPHPPNYARVGGHWLVRLF